MRFTGVGKSVGTAVFEVILIIMGVWLALQLDNWNEARKEASFELKILQGIHEDLKSNAEKLLQSIESDVDLIEGNQYLLGVVRDPSSVYSEDLDELFGSINRYEVFYPQRLSYETLKQRGLEVVRNEALRSEIINLYDYSYMTNSEVEMEIKKGLYENSNVVFLRHLDTGPEVYIKRPNDFAALKRDQEFINHLAHVTAEQKAMSFFAEERLADTLMVMEKIRAEIESLQ